MIYAVFLEDEPSKAEMRPKHMPAHLAFLEGKGAQIQAAGPLTGADGKPAGGLWVVEAESAEAVMALVQEDPFWPTGLRKSVKILAWKQVFLGGKRQM